MRNFEFKDTGLSEEALGMVVSEDVAQREKWGEQIHDAHVWNTILGEEVGELARAILTDNIVGIEKEATQAATVALKIAYMARKAREEYESRI